MSRAYLVQYGRPGFVGRFWSAGGVRFGRDDRVVIRGPRGTEIGTVLCALVAPAADDGEILRAASAEDDLASERLDGIGTDILAAAGESGLPLTFVDVEATLDGAVILHGLPWAACDASGLFAELSARFGVPVRLLDLSRSPAVKDEPEPAGCGKPGCGSESGGCSSCSTDGGCSTGSCSRGKVKSADELTAYFANLRQQMEAATARTPLV